MNRLKASNVVLFSLLVLFFSLLTNMATATAETFSVPAGQSVVRNVDLKAEDEVSGRITVVSSAESKDINFTVMGPNGIVVWPTESVVVANFKFSAPEKGTYQLIFDNSGSMVDKTVAINYEVRHYWFGLPQEFVLMLIVVFVGVFGLVIFAMMKR